jgi:hypothetical protein
MGQILGPSLNAGKFELGYTVKFFHRDMSDILPQDWWSPAIFGRYAINKWLTVSGEGIIGFEYPDERRYSDYRSIGAGAGLVVSVIEIKQLQVALSFHYFEIMWFDRLQNHSHQNLRSMIGAIQIQRKFDYLGQQITLWVAPAYVDDTLLEYIPYPGYAGVKYNTPNKLGLIVGSDFLLFKHIHPFAHLVYADYFQPRLGAGYRF